MNSEKLIITVDTAASAIRIAQLILRYSRTTSSAANSTVVR